MTSFIYKHNNTSFELINYGTNKEPYFKAKDIADFLQYKNTNQAIKDHVWNSDKFTTENCPRDLIPQNNKFNTIYINESGLYQLIFSSKLEMAKHFKQWIFNDVLPSIRKTGQYAFNNHTIKPLLTFSIMNEYDLHKLVVNFCKVQYPHILLIVQSGELQDTQYKRSQEYHKGYEGGSFDIIISNLHKKYNGLCLEFKSPSGKGNISLKQLDMQKKYELNGFKTLISNNYNEILFQIVEYMRDTRLKCLHCSKKFKNTTTLNNHLKYFHKINL